MSLDESEKEVIHLEKISHTTPLSSWQGAAPHTDLVPERKRTFTSDINTSVTIFFFYPLFLSHH